MDVDGLEHLILDGGKTALGKVKEVLVEVNDDFYDQSDNVKDLLGDAGFVLREKKHSSMFENNSTYNQIWVRKLEGKDAVHV